MNIDQSGDILWIWQIIISGPNFNIPIRILGGPDESCISDWWPLRMLLKIAHLWTSALIHRCYTGVLLIDWSTGVLLIGRAMFTDMFQLKISERFDLQCQNVIWDQKINQRSIKRSIKDLSKGQRPIKKSIKRLIEIQISIKRSKIN